MVYLAHKCYSNILSYYFSHYSHKCEQRVKGSIAHTQVKGIVSLIGGLDSLSLPLYPLDSELHVSRTDGTEASLCRASSCISRDEGMACTRVEREERALYAMACISMPCHAQCSMLPHMHECCVQHTHMICVDLRSI